MINTDARCGQVRPHNFHNIPEAMKAYSSWVLWRYEKRDGQQKYTKVPYSIAGQHASVSDAASWSTFDDVGYAFQAGDCDGIGFVLTELDPFIFIDLDTPKSPEQIDRHNRILNAVDSYTELSPSGLGLHIIMEGSIPLPGRKREQIEIYDKLRYMTMTGNVWANRREITLHNEFANYLWHEMGRPARVGTVGIDQPQTSDDNAVIAMMFNAANGSFAHDLYEGCWKHHYPSSNGPSEADFALIDIIAYYTHNKAQVGRIFGYSYLGKRDKYLKRPNLVRQMIDRSFDRKLPPLDIGAVRAEIAAAVAAKRDQVGRAS